MTAQRPPRDNIVRATFPGPEMRASAGGGMPTMRGHFAVFNDWTRISSSTEGTFMERIAPGAFAKTFKENAPKVLFQHGKDPQVGDKPLGSIRSLTEDANGASYEVDLLDTSYNRDLLPGLDANLYGASFRFSVVKEDFNARPARSESNPEGIPERTVREAKVYEFGPVTFPAYAGATASVRSMTDEYLFDALTSDPDRLRALVDNALPPEEPAPATPPDESRGDPPPEVVPPTVTPDPPEGGSSDSREETRPVSEYETRDEKAARVTELQSVIKRAATEFPGVMPAEAQTRWDADNAELDALNRDIAAWDARVARVEAIAAKGERNTESATFDVPVIHKTRDIYDLGEIKRRARTYEDVETLTRENALRSIDSQRNAKDLNKVADLVENRDEGEEGKGEIARRVLQTGSPVYRSAFAKYLKRGNSDSMTAEERAAIAVVGTTTTGGYAVPYVFDPTMYHTGVWTAENPYRKACRIVEITNGNNWRTVTVGAITSAYATEAAAASENAPSFGQPTYTAQRAQAFATVSIETLEDRSDITQELTSVFAESKDTLEENKFTLGTGAGEIPFGMFRTLAYTAKNTAANDATAILDTTAVEGDLPLRYRANAAWFMNRSTIRQLQILDTSYRYFTGAGIQFPGNPQPNQLGSNGGGNTGLQLLGYPVWEVPSAVSTLTTDAAIIAVFVDPKSYIILDRIGMNVEVIPTMLDGATPSFPTGQRGIYVYWRNTAKPIAADAGRQLTVQ